MNLLNGSVQVHERTLLGYLFNNPNGCDEIGGLVSCDHFATDAHRKIFHAIVTVRDQGKPVNILSVCDEMDSNGQLAAIWGDGVKGRAAITEIHNESLFANSSLAEYAVTELATHRAARETALIGERMRTGELTPSDAMKALEPIAKGETGPGPQWLDIIERSVVSSNELASLELKPRKKLLGDWFREGDHGIIYAPRGVGKTWLALLIAKAISEAGAVGDWNAPGKANVLYIDGEMPPDLIRDRDAGLTRDGGEIEFLNHEVLFDRTGKVLNITEPALQRAILERCIKRKTKLLVLDNLSTLASGMKENDSFDWEKVNAWLLQFRRHKIAVILILHAGRNGEARGTSRREDNAFWIIKLDDAKKQSDDKRGARFISHFTKPSRNTQEEIPAYEWHVTTDPLTGQIDVTHHLAQSMDVFLKCLEDGVTECSQIAQELHVTPGTVSKWAHKAIKAGKVKKQGREYVLVNGNEEL